VPYAPVAVACLGYRRLEAGGSQTSDGYGFLTCAGTGCASSAASSPRRCSPIARRRTTWRSPAFVGGARSAGGAGARRRGPAHRSRAISPWRWASRARRCFATCGAGRGPSRSASSATAASSRWPRRWRRGGPRLHPRRQLAGGRLGARLDRPRRGGCGAGAGGARRAPRATASPRTAELAAR
jgi:hypothetical protein